MPTSSRTVLANNIGKPFQGFWICCELAVPLQNPGVLLRNDFARHGLLGGGYLGACRR